MVPALSAVRSWIRRHSRIVDAVIMAVLFLYDAMNLGVQHVGLEVISQAGLIFAGSSRFVVNDPAVAGIHATVLAALVSRIRVR